ncbi:MAG: glycosyltransferase [Acidobacteriota bacterium]
MAIECREYSDRDALVQSPVVSVVMPAYNHEKYIADAIEGVVGQNAGFSIELIVGDDCSPDLTASIALGFLARFPEIIRVMRWQQNVGMHENAHHLLKAARGRYIAFCEGDDCWHRSDKLASEVRILESRKDAALVCSNWRTIADDGTIITQNALCLPPQEVHPLDLDHILAGQIKTASVCARANLLLGVLRDSPLCQLGRYPFGDAPLWVAVSQLGRCFCLSDELASYRLSSNSATRPRNIMNVYRFVAGAAEFKWDVLSLYPLRRGEGATKAAMAAASRVLLRASAMLGDANRAEEQFARLRALAIPPTIHDRLLHSLALATQRGRPLGPIFRAVLVLWHSVMRRILPLRGRTEAQPEATMSTESMGAEHSHLNDSDVAASCSTPLHNAPARETE